MDAAVAEIFQRFSRSFCTRNERSAPALKSCRDAAGSGADVALLIGRHGQTIDAVQYLLNAISHRTHGDERKEVIVDAAGYRARRRVTLESLAVRTAQQVTTSGERVELDPMTAVERKVVHLRLKEFDGVETASEGTEPNRYVVVLPA